MAKSSRFARLDEDVLLEFIYHDQHVDYVDDVKIENDENGSQLKYLNTVDGDDSASRFLIHELGADVVNFTVTGANGYVSINNFASRHLLLRNGKTYKFDLSDSSIDNPAGFNIGGNGTLNGTVYTYTPLTNGKYSYTYADLSGESLIGGEIEVSNRASSLYSVPEEQTGNDIKTAPGEVGRWYAVPTDTSNKMALLNNSLDYLDSVDWIGTSANNLTVVDSVDVNAVWYDTIRLHLRTGYSFSGRGYDGFVFQTKVKKASGTYNYFNSTVYLNTSNFEYQNPQPFVLGESSYSKFIEIKVPSLVHLNNPNKNKEFSDTFFGTLDPVNYSTNYEIDFKLINRVETIGGYDYIDIVEGTTLTLSQEDEFVDISANIEEANDGDYFKIYGTKDGSQDNFSRYITDRIETSSDDIVVFHDIEVSEQIGFEYLRTYLTSFVQTSNYDDALFFRPVILNAGASSNFLIRHNMRIYNETDNTQIVKSASLIYNKPKKYGKNLAKLNVNVDPNVIYNTLPNTSLNREINQFVNSIRPSVGETKYVPVALDTHNILASSVNATVNETEANFTDNIKFMEEGEGTITLSKVSDNFVKFNIAQNVGDEIKSISLVNAENIILIIKSGSIEQTISHDPTFPDIDAGSGEVFFKIPKSVAIRFDRKDTNISADKFYINLKNGQTESLLYHGKVSIV